MGNFRYKTPQMLRKINCKRFIKLLRKSKLKSISITLEIDSSGVNVEDHQEGAAKGHNPKKPGNRCYNIQLALCDEIKAYLTGYLRSGDPDTANGAAAMIKITLRMDSGYFDDAILETIESLGGKDVIKGKGYPTLVAQLTDPSIIFGTSEFGRETTALVTALHTGEKDRSFVVSRVWKDEKDRAP